jgi:hypothetical protein
VFHNIKCPDITEGFAIKRKMNGVSLDKPVMCPSYLLKIKSDLHRCFDMIEPFTLVGSNIK